MKWCKYTESWGQYSGAARGHKMEKEMGKRNTRKKSQASNTWAVALQSEAAERLCWCKDILHHLSKQEKWVQIAVSKELFFYFSLRG